MWQAMAFGRMAGRAFGTARERKLKDPVQKSPSPLGRKGPVKFVKVETEAAPVAAPEQAPVAEGPATEEATQP
ncbi:MAG: hypothetical protein RL549_1559 [Verrucomicrobiota bacterium]